MISWSPTTLLAAVLLPGVASPTAVRGQTGAIEGVARIEAVGAPVHFALVRLVRPDSSPIPSDGPPQGITNASGRYRFDGVAPGRYRVQLLHSGFLPVFSEPAQVGAGETVQASLRVASQRVELPPVAVTPEVCVTAGELPEYPQIQALWREARVGAAVRAALMARYRYTVSSRHERRELRPDGPTPVRTLASPLLVNDPTSAPSNEAIRRAQRLSSGYYGRNDSWHMPSELDVLHEDFLESHCLTSAATRGRGEVGLRFRPLRSRRNVLDVRGTLWLDSATYLTRRIEVEYVDGDESRGTFRLDYSDVAVGGGVLRMPVGGPYDLRPSPKDPAKHITGKLTQAYSGFEEGTSPPVTRDGVDAFVLAEMARRHIPGLSLAVVKAGTVVKAKGYGFADVDRREPVTPATIFRIGSVSKQFIAAGIMLLTQDGKLTADDPISKHLPRTPASWDSITLRHFLTHTSGVLRDGPAWGWNKVQPDSVVVESAYTEPLLFPTGSAGSYCNVCYFALADVIARVSGTPWDVFLRQRVFAPQGMTSTRTTTPTPTRATGYFWHEKGFLRKARYTVAPNNIAVPPSGGLQSTVLDFAKWDAALYRDDVLTRASRAAMWTPMRLTDGTPFRFGYGWLVDVVEGHRRVSHGGNVPGFTSHIVRFVDGSLTVIVLTNNNGDILDGLADQVARAFVPALRPKPWP